MLDFVIKTIQFFLTPFVGETEESKRLLIQEETERFLAQELTKRIQAQEETKRIQAQAQAQEETKRYKLLMDRDVQIESMKQRESTHRVQHEALVTKMSRSYSSRHLRLEELKLTKAVLSESNSLYRYIQLNSETLDLYSNDLLPSYIPEEASLERGDIQILWTNAATNSEDELPSITALQRNSLTKLFVANAKKWLGDVSPDCQLAFGNHKEEPMFTVGVLDITNTGHINTNDSKGQVEYYLGCILDIQPWRKEAYGILCENRNVNACRAYRSNSIIKYVWFHYSSYNGVPGQRLLKAFLTAPPEILGYYHMVELPIFFNNSEDSGLRLDVTLRIDKYLGEGLDSHVFLVCDNDNNVSYVGKRFKVRTAWENEKKHLTHLDLRSVKNVPKIVGVTRSTDTQYWLLLSPLAKHFVDVLDISENVIKTLVSTLKAAHTNGIVHRDARMANIYQSNDGQVILNDWASAAYIGTSQLWEGAPLELVPSDIRQAARNHIEVKVEAWHDVYILVASLYMFRYPRERIPKSSRDRSLRLPPIWNHAFEAALDVVVDNEESYNKLEQLLVHAMRMEVLDVDERMEYHIY